MLVGAPVRKARGCTRGVREGKRDKYNAPKRAGELSSAAAAPVIGCTAAAQEEEERAAPASPGAPRPQAGFRVPFLFGSDEADRALFARVWCGRRRAPQCGRRTPLAGRRRGWLWPPHRRYTLCELRSPTRAASS